MTEPIHSQDIPADQSRKTFWTIGLLELAKRAALIWGVGLLLAWFLYGITSILSVILVLFAGVLFGVLLHGCGHFLSRHTGLGEGSSLALAVVLILAVAIGGGWFLLPQLAEQTNQLQQSLPKSIAQFESRLMQYQGGRWLLQHAPEPNELVSRERQLFQRLTGMVSRIAEVVGFILVILFTGLYLAVQPRLYTEGMVRLVPMTGRDRAREVLQHLGSALRKWLLGQFSAMLLVGVLTWLGLMLLGIQLALSLGVIAAVLAFIPNFGPIISAVPAVLMGLLQSPMTAVWVVLLYVAIQTVESYVITPMIQHKAVDLPPALIITAQLILGWHLGGLGLILATPMTVVLMVLIQMLYVNDALGDNIKIA